MHTSIICLLMVSHYGRQQIKIKIWVLLFQRTAQVIEKKHTQRLSNGKNRLKLKMNGKQHVNKL